MSQRSEGSEPSTVARRRSMAVEACRIEQRRGEHDKTENGTRRQKSPEFSLSPPVSAARIVMGDRTKQVRPLAHTRETKHLDS